MPKPLRPATAIASRRIQWFSLACALLLPLLWGGPATAATPDVPGPTATRSSTGLSLQPTPTCPAEALSELQQAIAFVQGETWAEHPGNVPLNLSPDLSACRVVLNIGHLTKTEEAALSAGGGSRLAITYRHDWARPSRLLLILWIVFGGSGLIWMYWRYARR